MEMFHVRYPQLAEQETRTATVVGRDGLPDDEYGFVEYYCADENCDCRRVLFVVKSRRLGKDVATINYGWETVQFYKRVFRAPGLAETAAGANLDPLGAQAPFAPALLRLFAESFLTDPEYVARLKRHYELFKAAGPSGSKKTSRVRSANTSEAAPFVPPVPAEKLPYLKNRKANLEKKRRA